MIQTIWDDFYSIYRNLQSFGPDRRNEAQRLKRATEKWIKLFISVYQTKDVMPYIHILYCHVPEVLEAYGSIAIFNQQGLEKLNDELTQSYFRSTNHRDEESLKQLLLKLNRLQELVHSGQS